MDDHVEYFAVGSMMNKTSLTMRDLRPSKSRPAFLKDFELIFGMKGGMAAARHGPGCEMHGVVHRITNEELVKLDKIEFLYVREKVEVFVYDGDRLNVEESVLAFVYVFRPDMVTKDPNEYPPTERYMDILKEGAKHFGVDKDYISKTLNEVSFVPRKAKADMKSFKTLAGFDTFLLPTWTIEEAKEKNQEDQDTFYGVLNNYIIRLDIAQPCAQRSGLETCRGKQLAHLIASKWIYDPLYGVPDSYEDMSHDQRSAVEDWFLDFILAGDLKNRWRLVGQMQ